MQPWTKRTLIRATFAAVLALVGSLVTATVDNSVTLNEVMVSISLGLGAAAAWLGVGSQSMSIEPFLNNSEPMSVDVPKPPADVKPAK